MKRFQSKLGFDKDKHYKYVTDDLYNNGVFDKHEKEIATDFSKKVKTLDEINILKAKRKNDNDFKGVWYYMSEEVKFVIDIIKNLYLFIWLTNAI